MERLTSLTDEQLVSLYSKGNNEAFDILLNRYESKVYSYITYYVKNKELVEDLFQDTFMRIVSHIRTNKYTEQQKFNAWVMRITHNIMIDHFRRQSNEKNISKDENEVDILNDTRFADEENIETSIIRDQNLSRVEALISMLPANQREIINLRYYEDLSFKEISELLHCSINTALGRTRYALINLRKLAAEYNINMAS